MKVFSPSIHACVLLSLSYYEIFCDVHLRTSQNYAASYKDPPLCKMAVCFLYRTFSTTPKKTEVLACELGPNDRRNTGLFIVDLDVDPAWVAANRGLLRSGEVGLGNRGNAGQIDVANGVLRFPNGSPPVFVDPPGRNANAPPQADNIFNYDGRRRLAMVQGTKEILVVRVIAPDASTTPSKAELSDAVFGTNGDPVNLKSQYEACSADKLILNPTSTCDPRVTDGVYTVTITEYVTNATNSVVRNAVQNQLAADLGPLPGAFDHVMYCLPPGTSGSWIAYAYVNWWLKVGHNLNLAHSGEGTAEYADQSGMMGYSYGSSDTPIMCFNAAKSWQLGWYDGVNSTSSFWSGNLVGIADYGSTVAGEDKVLVQIDIPNSDIDYYVNFNRKSGINSGTVEGGNQVMVVEQGGGGSS